MIWSLLLIAVRHRRLRRPELPPVLYSPQVKISTRTQKIFAIFGAGRGRAGRAGRDRGASVHRARIQVPDADAGCSVHIYYLYKYFYELIYLQHISTLAFI